MVVQLRLNSVPLDSDGEENRNASPAPTDSSGDGKNADPPAKDQQGEKVPKTSDECCSVEIEKTSEPSTTNAGSAPNSCGGSEISAEEANNLLKSAKEKKLSTMQVESLREKLHLEKFREALAWLQGKSDEEGHLHKEHFLHVLAHQEFLRLLFQLFDHERDNVIVQEKWIELLKSRLTEEKHQIDFAEVIESVAYAVCGNDDVDFEKFSQIFKTKGVLNKLFRLVDHDQDGVVTANQVMEFLANLTNARPRVGLTKENVQWLEQVFRQTVGDEKEIHLNDFRKIVQSKNTFFSDRVFQIFDRDNSGAISLQEFIDAMHQFAGQSPDDKIRFLFKVYDLDGDGLIQVQELQHVMRACMEENGMEFSDDQIADLISALVEDADCEYLDAITYEALKAQLEKHDGLLQNLSISIDRWLVPPKPKEGPKTMKGKLLAMRPYQLSYPYMKNNYVYLCFLLCYLAVNVGLFVSRAIEYSDQNGYVIIARACGQCLNFNCMFIMLLILRHWITLLRAHGLSSFLPLDQHIYFHKMTGIFIFIFSMVHTVMHLFNLNLVVQNPSVNVNNLTYSEWLFTAMPGKFGLIDGAAFPTGVVLTVILIIMVICSQPFVRRGGCFEVFYFTHLLYIPFWILVIFHGPNFWKWFIGPFILFLMERIIRVSKMRTGHGKTYISSGVLLPSKVTHLVIKRPQYFDFHPGDYVFVNVPRVAKYEWHPFTISSAPEQDDAIWLHIRAVGEWTNTLYDYFEREHAKLQCFDNVSGLDSASKGTSNPMLKRLLSSQSSRDKSECDQKDASAGARKLLGFQNNSSGAGVINASFEPEDQDASSRTLVPGSVSSDDTATQVSLSEENESTDKITPIQGPTNNSEPRRKHIVLARKNPLSKSVSLPDVQNRVKKRERLLALRTLARSESDKSFDGSEMRVARMRTAETTSALYSTPQNRSVAKSFRYMRNKPTIIAFKTPSFENRMQSPSSVFNSPERSAEEGRAEMKEGKKTDDTSPLGKPLEIFIDGPYGAPSSHIFRAQHAVLIGTGIGVTPFASILQSIMHRYWKARHTCPKCTFTWAGDIPHTVMNLKKVDFFWINRDQRSFEWFVNLLSQLEIEQVELGDAMERFLDMHMYITSALQKTDMKAVGLQLALDLLHEKEKRDLITGLKTRTIAGRPNWTKVFKQIADQKKGKVTVFYCGPPALARALRVKCDEFGFRFRKENF